MKSALAALIAVLAVPTALPSIIVEDEEGEQYFLSPVLTRERRQAQLYGGGGQEAVNKAEALLDSKTQMMIHAEWVTFALVFTFLLTLYKFLTRHHNYWKNRGVPYKKPHFLFGNLYEVFAQKQTLPKYLGHLYKQFEGPYFGVFLCGKPGLVIKDPEIIKRITVKDFGYFSDRSLASDKKADACAARTLFLVKNPEWKFIRNKVSWIFSVGKMKSVLPSVVETSEIMQSYLEKFDNEVIDVRDLAGKFMTKIGANLFFGIQCNPFHKKDEFVTITHQLFDLTLYRAFCFFSYLLVPEFVSLFKLKITDYTEFQQIFLQSFNEKEKMGKRKNDFLDYLIDIRDRSQKDDEKVLDKQCVEAQTLGLLMAAIETTGNLIGFSIYELAKNQQCQEKLRQEIREVFADDDPVTYEKLKSIKYLDMVLWETLRLYPLGQFINRICTSDYIIEETGLKVERGTSLFVPLDGIHFDPKFYPNPKQFDPERFQFGTKELKNSGVFMPFGSGPRYCIGDRFALLCAKTALVHMLCKYKFDKSHLLREPVVLDTKSPFLKPKYGLHLLVKKI